MLKVGLLGAGFMGSMHAACYAEVKGVELALVADADLERAEKLAVKHEAQLAENMEEITEDPQIDIIDICLPTYLHKEYTVRAAQARKNIICEKPIALALEDADEMVKATKAAGVKFMVANVVRFWPEYEQLRTIYNGGKLGPLQILTLIRLSPSPNWNEWVTDVTRGGGALFDLHIHDVDFLVYTIGQPTGVISQGSLDHVVSLFSYPELEVVVVEGGFMPSAAFDFRMAFRATFKNGVVEFDNTSPHPFSIYYKGKKEPEYWKFTPPRQLSGNFGGNISTMWPYVSEIQYFISCLTGDKEPVKASGESAKRSLEAVLAEKHALETGEFVNIHHEE